VFDAIQSLALPSLLAWLVLGFVVAGEIGRRLGARSGRAGRARVARRLAGASVAAMALLIACSVPMALTRSDMRRAAVLAEAGALRDAAHLAPLLPDDDGVAIVNDLRRTLDLALDLGASADPKAFDADVAETATVSARMWEHLGAAGSDQPASSSASRMAQGLTAVDDAVARRTAALLERGPPMIDAMLAGTALAAMAFAGYGAGAPGTNRRGALAIMALILSAVVTGTLDLQRPTRGAVQSPPTPLQDLRPLLPPLP
jgi:hypothetical protein